MKLYDITWEMQEIMKFIDDTKSVPASKRFAELSGCFVDKFNAYCRLIANHEADIKAIDDEIYRLDKRKWALEETRVALKSSLMSAMDDLGFEKYETALFSASIDETKSGRFLKIK